jgi:predicted metalloprotease
MRLDDVNERGNVDDSRGNKKTLAVGGGIGALIIALVAGYLGIDPKLAQKIVGGVGGGQQVAGPPPKDGMLEFSEKVLGTTNVVWDEQFRKNFGKSYKHPEMKLFSEGVDSEGCGYAPSSVGPFYCPASKKVFLDPTFFEELEKKLGGSKADFSKAYVIAHEVGHHVQNLLGYNARVEDFRKREGENAGIRLELQADYLAGVWAHHADRKYRILEKGDVESALTTARAIGDNRIQEKMKGKSWPESFNHGTDKQRMKYFSEGLQTGDASQDVLDRFFNPRVKPLEL